MDLAEGTKDGVQPENYRSRFAHGQKFVVEFLPTRSGQSAKPNLSWSFAPIDRDFTRKPITTNVRPGTSLPVESGIEGRRGILPTLIRSVKSAETIGKTPRSR